MRKAHERYNKYVNSEWEKVYSEIGQERLPTPSDQEAITGCKRLYRKFMGHSWKGKIKIVSGNKYTRVRRMEGTHGVMYINPNRKSRYGMLPFDGGWEQLVHTLSHHIGYRKFDEGHGTKQLWLEAKMTRYVLKNKFYLGTLKSKPRKIPIVKDADVEKLENIEKKLARWTTKLKRANTAIKKLNKKKKYYENKKERSTR
jgi:hypothetical protein